MGKRPILAAELLAAKQHGAIARRQALALGMSAKAIRSACVSGRWAVRGRGVYIVQGAPRTFQQELTVALLDEVDGAAISHLAAGVMHALVTTRPARIDVTVPHAAHDGRRRAALVHRARSLGQGDVVRVDGIRVTCVARTLVDLAGVVDDDRLQHAVDTALNKGLVSIARVERYITDRHLGSLRGVGRLRRILRDRSSGVLGSGLERAFRRLLRQHGLPEPARQHRVGRPQLDFAYPSYRLAIEIDGDGHGTVAALRADDRRQNKIVLAGWDVLRFTEDRVYGDRAAVAREVARALRQRGWTPSPALRRRGHLEPSKGTEPPQRDVISGLSSEKG